MLTPRNRNRRQSPIRSEKTQGLDHLAPKMEHKRSSRSASIDSQKSQGSYRGEVEIDLGNDVGVPIFSRLKTSPPILPGARAKRGEMPAVPALAKKTDSRPGSRGSSGLKPISARSRSSQREYLWAKRSCTPDAIDTSDKNDSSPTGVRLRSTSAVNPTTTTPSPDDLNELVLSDDEPTSTYSGNQNSSEDGPERSSWRVMWKDGVSIRAEPDEEAVLLGILTQGSVIQGIHLKNMWVKHSKGWSPVWDPYCEVVMMRRVASPTLPKRRASKVPNIQGSPPAIIAPSANRFSVKNPLFEKPMKLQPLTSSQESLASLNRSPNSSLTRNRYGGSPDSGNTLGLSSSSNQLSDGGSRGGSPYKIEISLSAESINNNNPPALTSRLRGLESKSAKLKNSEIATRDDAASCIMERKNSPSYFGGTGALPPPLPLFSPTPKQSADDGLPNHLGLPMMAAPKLLAPQEHEQPPEKFFMTKGGSQEDLVHRVKKDFLQRMAVGAGQPPNIVFDSILKPNGASASYFKPDERGVLTPYYTPANASDTTLVFESRFESGNLRRAIKVSEGEYDLLCRPDINTNSYAQWFYFSVANTRTRRYKFNIINMLKSDSLFNKGMMPLVYSTKEAEDKGVGWKREGFDICYYRNSKKYHTATFTIHSRHKDDTLYLAYCYPYTYSDLQADLARYESNAYMRNYIRRRVLCETLCGNDCDVLTITDFDCSNEEIKSRRAIVASARVHPGESNASWMMKGLIEFLLGKSSKAASLRKRFLFKIVPMLNPDGVVLGNYRCGIAGHDLNRYWNVPQKDLHPTIVGIKNLIKRLSIERELVMTTDLHGHSRAMNIFMYGCNHDGDPDKRLQERVFPLLLEANSPVFKFSSCHFKVKKAKAGCARIVVWKEAKIVKSYTMEASFAGANHGAYAGKHFTAGILMNMGRDWCLSILQYEDQKQRAKIKRRLEEMYPKDTHVEEEGESDEDDSADSAEERPPGPGEKLLGLDMSCAIKAKVQANGVYSRSVKKIRRRRTAKANVRHKSLERDSAAKRILRKDRKKALHKSVKAPPASSMSPSAKARKLKERGWNRPSAEEPSSKDKKLLDRWRSPSSKASKSLSVRKLSRRAIHSVRRERKAPLTMTPEPPARPLKGQCFTFEIPGGGRPQGRSGARKGGGWGGLYSQSPSYVSSPATKQSPHRRNNLPPVGALDQKLSVSSPSLIDMQHESQSSSKPPRAGIRRGFRGRYTDARSSSPHVKTPRGGASLGIKKSPPASLIIDNPEAKIKVLQHAKDFAGIAKPQQFARPPVANNSRRKYGIYEMIKQRPTSAKVKRSVNIGSFFGHSPKH